MSGQFHHKFLATKSWHVLNPSNQAAVAAAEAHHATLQRRVEERKKTLERERNRQQSLALVAQSEGKGADGEGSSVAFLYQPPPGFVPALAPPRVRQEDAPATNDELTEVHDLTRAPDAHANANVDAQPAPALDASGKPPLPFNAPPPSMQPGPDGSVAPLESHAERRERHRNMSAQAIREELHPALRGAPVTAPHVRGMVFTAKPLGVLLRDTRCIRCGGIGHSSTDRECPRFNDTHTAADQSRLVREDPLTKLQAIAPATVAPQSQPATSARYMGPASGTGSGVAGGKPGQFKLVYNDEAWTAGGLAADHPLQQVLLDDDDECAPADPAVIAQAQLDALRSKRHRKRVKHEHADARDSAHSAAGSAALSAGDAATAASSASASAPASATGLTPAELAFYSSLPAADMRILLKQLKKSREGDDRNRTSSSSKRHKKQKRSKREVSQWQCTGRRSIEICHRCCGLWRWSAHRCWCDWRLLLVVFVVSVSVRAQRRSDDRHHSSKRNKRRRGQSRSSSDSDSDSSSSSSSSSSDDSSSSSDSRHGQRRRRRSSRSRSRSGSSRRRDRRKRDKRSDSTAAPSVSRPADSARTAPSAFVTPSTIAATMSASAGLIAGPVPPPVDFGSPSALVAATSLAAAAGTDAAVRVPTATGNVASCDDDMPSLEPAPTPLLDALTQPILHPRRT